MRKLLLFFLLFSLTARAQERENNKSSGREKTKYLLFNPFSLLEDQVSVGLGYENRFTERSSLFTDLAWVTPASTYRNRQDNYNINGYRLIAQYRYHFQQKEAGLLRLLYPRNRIRKTHEAFMALETRVKQYRFSYTLDFANPVSSDTLYKFPYKATATVFGAAWLMGREFRISGNDKWRGEVTLGIGGRYKWVRFRNVPAGYTPVKYLGGFGLKAPSIEEETGIVYFPGTIRIKMRIGK